MLDFSDPQGKVALAIIILVVVAAGYFLWTRSAPPVPQRLPGQRLRHRGRAPRPEEVSRRDNNQNNDGQSHFSLRIAEIEHRYLTAAREEVGRAVGPRLA